MVLEESLSMAEDWAWHGLRQLSISKVPGCDSTRTILFCSCCCCCCQDCFGRSSLALWFSWIVWATGQEINPRALAPKQASPAAFARHICLLDLRFFVQGDKMKELGLPVPALNDRAKTQRPLMAHVSKVSQG